METTLPFATFKRKEHLSPAVKVTEPFSVLRIGEM